MDFMAPLIDDEFKPELDHTVMINTNPDYAESANRIFDLK